MQARKRVTGLCGREPEIIIESIYSSAQKAVAKNEKADEWAQLAADGPPTSRRASPAHPVPQWLPAITPAVTSRCKARDDGNQVERSQGVC